MASAEEVPVPLDPDEENLLFGQGGQAQPGVTPQQAPNPAQAGGAPQQLVQGGTYAQAPPVAPPVSVGLDPTLQQVLVQMLQTQQEMMRAMNRRMDEEERRRKQLEDVQASVANPFGAATASGSPTGSPHAGPSTAPGPSPVAASGSGGGGMGGNRAEKYLPSLPLLDASRMGKGRVHELEEYHRWCEVLASWLALVDDAYVTELREAILLEREIRQTALPAQVASRSARLYYYLQQSLQKFDRGMELVRSTSMRQGQAACGYECMRQLHSTFSVVSRMEAIAVRDGALALYTKAGHCKRPLEVVRFLEDELGKCDMKLHRFPELKLGTSDRHTILLQSVSSECRQYLLLHGRSDTWENLVASIKFYEEQTRLCDPHSKLHAVGDGKGQQGKVSVGIVERVVTLRLTARKLRRKLRAMARKANPLVKMEEKAARKETRVENPSPRRKPR